MNTSHGGEFIICDNKNHLLFHRELRSTLAPGYPRILVQSKSIPDWAGIGVQGWLTNADLAIDLKARLKLDSLKAGLRFRFRIRANPCVTRDGKRLGLLRADEQEAWLERKVLYDGILMVTEPQFQGCAANRYWAWQGHGTWACVGGADCMKKLVGPAKAFGCGLFLVRRL